MFAYRVFWFLLVGVVIAVRAWVGDLSRGFIANLLCVFLLISVVYSRKSVHEFLQTAVPPPHRHFCVLLLFLVLTGHFTDISRGSFPFVNWHMFGSSGGPAIYYRYEGYTRDGKKVVLVPGRLFPPLGQGTWRLKIRLDTMIGATFSKDDPNVIDERSLRDLLRMLRAIGHEYNRGRPDKQLLTQLHLIQCETDVHTKREKRNELLKLPLESGQ